MTYIDHGTGSSRDICIIFPAKSLRSAAGLQRTIKWRLAVTCVEKIALITNVCATTVLNIYPHRKPPLRRSGTTRLWKTPEQTDLGISSRKK